MHIQGSTVEAIADELIKSGGPQDSGTKAEAVKWHDDKVGSPGVSLSVNGSESNLPAGVLMVSRGTERLDTFGLAVRNGHQTFCSVCKAAGAQPASHLMTSDAIMWRYHVTLSCDATMCNNPTRTA